MLGIDVARSTIIKYMVKRRGPPSRGWKTFLCNHADGIASVDFLIVPTISFKLLHAFAILGHGQRKILQIGVTDHPTTDLTARQITEAFLWDEAPDHLIILNACPCQKLDSGVFMMQSAKIRHCFDRVPDTRPKFPVPPKIFPVIYRREFAVKRLNLRTDLRPKCLNNGGKRQISLFIPVKQGNCAETGSIAVASTASRSLSSPET